MLNTICRDRNNYLEFLTERRLYKTAVTVVQKNIAEISEATEAAVFLVYF